MIASSKHVTTLVSLTGITHSNVRVRIIHFLCIHQPQSTNSHISHALWNKHECYKIVSYSVTGLIIIRDDTYISADMARHGRSSNTHENSNI